MKPDQNPTFCNGAVSSKGVSVRFAINTILCSVCGILLCALPSRGWGTESTNDTAELYLPDGQLKSHLIRVYVNRDITESMKPALMLHTDHAVTRSMPWEDKPIPFYILSRDHRWTQKFDEQPAEKRGTLLLFDLHKNKIPFYKAMIRITPSFVWTDRDQNNSVTSTTEVYLANTIAAVSWSALVISAIGCFIAYLSWASTAASGRPALARIFATLANPDGSLSTWRVQLAAWTAAIGCVVFGFALIRLEVPQIPETLIALMGLSLATGGLSALKQPPAPDVALVPGPPAAFAPPVAPAVPIPPALLPMRLSDLVSNFNKDTQQREVSVAKSQMVFWSILTLGIFIAKSVTDGTLWPVPWQMVALMGMSQAGYVAPKFVPQQP